MLSSDWPVNKKIEISNLARAPTSEENIKGQGDTYIATIPAFTEK